MKKKDQNEAVLQAFLHGLKLGHVLKAQVDSIADHYIGLMIPATLEGSDDSDHFGQVNFHYLKTSGEISVYFDTLDERIQYAAQGCEHEAWIEGGMALDSEHWQKQKAAEEKESGNAATH
jgi:hypothetical protein